MIKYFVYSILYSDEKIFLCQKKLKSSFYCSECFQSSLLDKCPMQYNAFPINTAGMLVFPGGARKALKNAIEEARREFFEELGIDVNLNQAALKVYQPRNDYNINFVIKKFTIADLQSLMDNCVIQLKGKNDFIKNELEQNPQKTYYYSDIKQYTRILDDEIDTVGSYPKNQAPDLYQKFLNQKGTDWFAEGLRLANLI